MVGYCDAPKHSRFKPGRSGNPSGRPKARRTIAHDICLELDAIPPGQEISNQQLIARRLVERGVINGDTKAISLIAMLIQQHRAPGESDVVDEVDAEIIGRFGRSDPAPADQQEQGLLPGPKSESEEH